MHASPRNFLLGLTTLIALGGLVTLLMLFGELDRLVKPRYHLTIRTADAVGLRSGSSIELNGVPVGLVGHVITTNDPDYPVEIVAMLDTNVRIPAAVVPYATASLLGGAATLQLEGLPPVVDRPSAYLPTDGSAVIAARIGSRLIEQVRNEFAANFGSVVELADNLNDLLRPVVDGDDPEAARESIRTVVRNINDWLETFRTTLEDFQARLAQAESGLDAFESLARSLQTDSHRVAGELLPVLAELETTLQRTSDLAHLATNGEGTVGQLLNNPDLYRSLSDTLKTLDQVLVELKLVLEKTRREGVKVNL